MTAFKAIVEGPSTVEWLSSLTPVELLTEANRGFKIRDIDHNFIAELRNQGFADGIINVMLYFVLIRSRGLRFNEVRKLAAAWHDVATVEEAVTLAEQAFLDWENNRPVRLTNTIQGSG
jgi:replication initiation and membrane attachment protein DnaB